MASVVNCKNQNLSYWVNSGQEKRDLIQVSEEFNYM